jgi:hypothetical protein
MVRVEATAINKLALVINHNPRTVVVLRILKNYHPRLNVIFADDLGNIGKSFLPLLAQ